MNSNNLEKVARACHDTWREFIDEEPYDELVSKDVWLAIAQSAVKSHVEMFAQRCKDAMELHENSWNPEIGDYEFSIRNAVAEVFGDDPMGMIAFLVIFSAWNDVDDWLNYPQPCGKITFKEK